MSRSLLAVVGGVCAVLVVGLVMVLGLAFVPASAPSVDVPLRASVHVATWMAYVDPYGTSAPGGAPSPDSSAAGVTGSAVASGFDGLSQVPFPLLGGLAGVLVLWWAVSFVWGFFR